jgi:hypothetical protein
MFKRIKYMNDVYNIYIGPGNFKKKNRVRTLALSIYKDDVLLVRGQYIMVTLAQGQAVSFTVETLDSKGRPAPIDGVPVYTNSDPVVADLFVAGDGTSGTITWADAGTATISVAVDADLGEGVRTLTASVDVVCGAAEAVSVAFVVGTPTP